MFLGHVRLIERYPALAKLVFSDHLRLQYPSLQARFSRIHKAYSARLRAVLDRAKAEGVVRGPLASKDAATMFLSLIQGLGFQFAIARLPLALVPEAERVFTIYLQAITSAADAVEYARAMLDASKRDRGRRQRVTDPARHHLAGCAAQHLHRTAARGRRRSGHDPGRLLPETVGAGRRRRRRAADGAS